mmetsp:Transcript_84717/g.244895  ORF Transcript_84717/g.244895 Transcript_84717/m.244895 type:complete len:234 (-) Transcript_84717:490-1191(-)
MDPADLPRIGDAGRRVVRRWICRLAPSNLRRHSDGGGARRRALPESPVERHGVRHAKAQQRRVGRRSASHKRRRERLPGPCASGAEAANDIAGCQRGGDRGAEVQRPRRWRKDFVRRARGYLLASTGALILRKVDRRENAGIHPRRRKVPRWSRNLWRCSRRRSQRHLQECGVREGSRGAGTCGKEDEPPLSAGGVGLGPPHAVVQCQGVFPRERRLPAAVVAPRVGNVPIDV